MTEDAKPWPFKEMQPDLSPMIPCEDPVSGSNYLTVQAKAKALLSHHPADISVQSLNMYAGGFKGILSFQGRQLLT